MRFHGNNPGGGGRLYGPTTRGTLYLASSAHRAAGRPHKSQWNCAEPDESDCFELSERHDWLDSSDNWWWVGAAAQMVVGQKGERMAFFPVRSNVTDPAHGYPITLLQNRDYVVPNDLIDRWQAANHISGITAKRIKGRKI